VSAVRVIPLQTGTVQIRPSQRRAVGTGFARTWHLLTDAEWTAPLPILAWAVVHADGVLLVDTGETPRAAHRGYYPRWHPYYRRMIRVQLSPEDDIAVQLRRHGIRTADVRDVVFTHLHTDHAGGLAHFPHSTCWVTDTEYRLARGFAGRLRGYLSNAWPSWFAPTRLRLDDGPWYGFPRSQVMNATGEIRVVPTPGHTAGHVSVLVEVDGVTCCLAGDATYTEDALLDDAVDALSPSEAVAHDTLARLRALTRHTPTVYLPTHDPESVARFEARQVTRAADDVTAGDANRT